MLCNGFKMKKSIPKAPKLWGSHQPDASVHLSISGVWVEYLEKDLFSQTDLILMTGEACVHVT